MDELYGQKYIVEARGLIKKFGFKTALRKVDLSLTSGDCLALFGPNGAGKTTLIQILCSLMLPTSGKVVIAGLDTRYHRAAIHGLIGVIAHDTFLYGALTAVENLNFYGKMYNVSKLKTRVNDLIDRVGLRPYKNDPVHTYSRGMKQRLSVARAILHDPAVLFMDEPYTGLDQQGADDLQRLLNQFRDQRKTIVLASHNLARGLELCSHAAILHAGELIYHKNIAGIDKRDFKQLYVRLTGEKTWSHQASAQVSYENSRRSYGKIFFPSSDPKN